MASGELSRRTRPLPPSTLLWCGLLVAAAGTIILWALGQSGAELYVRDAAEYNQYALNLVRHGVFSNDYEAPFYPGVTRTPGYPGFLAFLHLIAMHSSLLVQIVQFALVALTAGLVYLIGLQVADRRTASISALLSATYLPLLWFAARVGPEVLTTALLTLAILLLLKAIAKPSWKLWVAIGLTFAAGAYVRPEIAGLGALAVGLIFLTGEGAWRSRARLAPALAILAAMLLALAPWMVRNTHVAHRFVPFDTYLGADLIASAGQYAGTFGYQTTQSQWLHLEAETNRISATVESAHPTAAEQAAADTALTEESRRIVSRLPVSTILKSLPRRLATLWGTADEYPSNQSWSKVVGVLGYLQYGALFVLVLAGMFIRRRTLLREWPLWLAVPYFTVLHLISHVESRYSLTARPAIIVYAGFALALLIGRMRPRLSARVAGSD
jgi:4-amino-4-deoxy-L-arabinose transferase-like glycosyltransferase